MTCHKIRFSSAICLPLLVLSFGAAAAFAQNTPEMREVLARLDRLEKDNQALTEEIRALRQELATTKSPLVLPTRLPPTVPPMQDDQPGTSEQRAVEQSRIQELAQTKVEASQKFPIRVTGMALFNAYVNGRYNNQTDNPTIASLGKGDATGGGNAAAKHCGFAVQRSGDFCRRKNQRIAVHGLLRRLDVLARSHVPACAQPLSTWIGITPVCCSDRKSP